MDFAPQVKASVDIVSVVGEYVRLRRIGSTQSYTGLCPFHTEKTPSFRVHANHQFFKCFGCGLGGDVFKFVMEMERVSFFEALKVLAERSGIPMPKRSEHADEATKLRAAIFQMHELAGRALRAALRGPSGVHAREYLAGRAVGPDSIEEFGLGYAERGGNLARLFEKEGFSAEQMEQSGLVRKRPEGGFFDAFRNRLMFPIHSESGQVIAFAGRALEKGDEPKYINSPETPIYRKSYVLYNLHRAKEAVRKTERVVLVEGYMDVIGASAAGVKEVVASCGTALTAQQVAAMKRHSEHIVVNFDPDAAGAKAAERSIQVLLEEGMRIRILALEGGLDPDEYCKERGADAYQAAIGQARNYFYWLADRARERYDMNTVEGRVAVFQFLLPVIQRIADKIERVAVAGDVASYLRVESGLVLENFRKAAAERHEQRMAVPQEAVNFTERILLNLLLANSEARDRFIPELQLLGGHELFPTRRVFEIVFKLHASGEPFGLAEVDARLEEAERGRLHAAVFSGETDGDAASLEQGEACVRTLERQTIDTKISECKSRIKEAEKAGKLSEALRMAEELSRLEKCRLEKVRHRGVVQ